MSLALFKKNYVTLLLGILFFAFVTRIFRLHLPEKYIFDEVYHAVTAKLIAKNDPRAFEWWNPPPEKDTAIDWLHPPFAKYTQAVAISLFGANSFGWRISSALFGTGVIFLIAHLSLKLTNSHAVSLLAALLGSLDGLLLVMSRIAMNDIHVTFAILLTLILYLRTKPFTKKDPNQSQFMDYFLTGATAGVAMASKWSGVFVLGIIYLYELLHVFEVLQQTLKKKNFSTALKAHATWITQGLITLVLVPLVVYILSYSQMFLQGKDLNHFIELHKQIWWYQSSLTATHDYQSTPSEWIINKRPVWFYVAYEPGKRGDIYAHGNSIILWSGLLTVAYFSLRILKKLLNVTDSTKPLQTAIKILRTPLAFLVASYFAMWIIWVQSPRIMFFYHYTPAIPFLVIILAYGLVKLLLLSQKHQPLAQATVFTVLSLSVLYFILFIPHWFGIPLKATFVESLYFMFDSWK